MKGNTPVLYPNAQVAERVTDYSAAHSTTLPKHITDFHEWASKNLERSIYLTSNFQSQCHILLAHMIGAKRVLEVGVYVGYSAMVWSHAVGPDGMVTGLEFNAEYAKIAEEAFAARGIKNIEMIMGDALETIPALKPSEPYDLIFIDAQKSGYPSYLSHILRMSRPGAANRLLRPGGLIVADNVLRRGIVADESDENPWAAEQKRGGLQSMGSAEFAQDSDLQDLRTFNDLMVGSDRLEVFLMPLFDGLGIGRLVD